MLNYYLKELIMESLPNETFLHVLNLIDSGQSTSAIVSSSNVSLSYVKKIRTRHQKYAEFKKRCILNASSINSIIEKYPEIRQAQIRNAILDYHTASVFHQYFKTINDFILYDKIYCFDYWSTMMMEYHYAIFREYKIMSRQVIVNNLNNLGIAIPKNTLACRKYNFPSEQFESCYPHYNINLYFSKYIIAAYADNNKIYFMLSNSKDTLKSKNFFIEKLAQQFKILSGFDSIIIQVTTESEHLKYRSIAVGYTFEKIKEQGFVPPNADSIIPV